MNMKVVNEMEYLGIKIALRRLVYSHFNHLIEKAASKLNLWGSKFLSIVGKITLLNSALLSLPIFVSTHSLVPVKILDDMEKMCRSFVWSKRDGNFGIHYVAWEFMCKPKEKRGYGVHSIGKRVGPLRSKFTLNFINNPGTLLNQSLTSKYGCDLWRDGRNRLCSSTWKILMHGASFLHPIMRWSLSDGSKLDTFKDIWILDRSIDRWPTFVSDFIPEYSCLSTFIANGSWNEDRLKLCFGQNLVELISSFPIQPDMEGDQLELLYKCSGKSVAALAMDISFKNTLDDINLRWRKRLKLRPGIDFFWWRLPIRAIPTSGFLKYRNLLDVEGCPRGCGDAEDEEHVAVKCKKLRQVVDRLVSWGFNIPLCESFD
ncbi:hypothetical protein M5K25_004616 [Dendrobium thyrsiflorum]|uniref:Uncharacterized protein n=1 Tax=Dendrobium thyrsiflorum TaxID=117978 RepID=A0ABD0VFA8_DENTH